MKYSKIFPKHGGDFMSSIRNITASSAVPDDLAKRLGPAGINEILLTLWQGYHDMIAIQALPSLKTLKKMILHRNGMGKYRYDGPVKIELLFYE